MKCFADSAEWSVHERHTLDSMSHTMYLNIATSLLYTDSVSVRKPTHFALGLRTVASSSSRTNQSCSSFVTHSSTSNTELL